MEHMDQQEEFNVNISPAAVAFVVLAVVMGLVGLYVTNQDIETDGVTADEARLPLSVENSETGIALRYPDGWQTRVEQGQLVVEPRDSASDEIVRMTVEHQFGSVADVLGSLGAADTEVTSLDSDVITGETFAATETISGEQIDVRYAIFQDEFNDVFLATLTTSEGQLSDQERLFELMLETVEYRLSLSNVAQRPSIGFSVPFPRTWTDQRDLQLPDRVTIAENPADPATSFFRFDVVPLESFNVTGTEENIALTVAQQIVETPGIIRLTDYNPIFYQRYSGVETSIEPENDNSQRAQVVVLDLSDGNVLIVLMLSRADRYDTLSEVLDSMLQRFEYRASPRPTDRLNDIRSNAAPPEVEEPVEEAETGVEVEEVDATDAATDTQAEAATDRVNEIRDGEAVEPTAPVEATTDTEAETPTDDSDVAETEATEAADDEAVESTESVEDMTGAEVDLPEEGAVIEGAVATLATDSASDETTDIDDAEAETPTDDSDVAETEATEAVDDEAVESTESVEDMTGAEVDLPEEGAVIEGAVATLATDSASDETTDIDDAEAETPTDDSDVVETEATEAEDRESTEEIEDATDTDSDALAESDDAVENEETETADVQDSSLEVVALTNLAERDGGLSMAYPEGWTDVQPENPQRVFVAEDINNQQSNFFDIQVAPPLAFNIVSTEGDFLREGARQLVESPEIELLTDYSDVVYNGYDAVTVRFQATGDASRQVRVVLLDLADGNIMLGVLSAQEADFDALSGALDEMLSTFEYAPATDEASTAPDADSADEGATAEE